MNFFFPFPASLFSSFPIPVPQASCSISLQLLCQNPLQRLRHLHHFQVHPFFRGVAFDPELLRKQPMNFVPETQTTQLRPLESMLFKDNTFTLKKHDRFILADSVHLLLLMTLPPRDPPYVFISNHVSSSSFILSVSTDLKCHVFLFHFSL